MNPDDREGSLEQAEYACFTELMNLLELQEGTTATIGVTRGFPDSMTWRIAALGTGETMTFPASAHYFRGVLDLYHRERPMLQRWIMRLISHFPQNNAYNRDATPREDANIVHFRIAPERGAVGETKQVSMATTNSGAVPTWTARILFDVVFIADPDYQDGGAGGTNAGGGDDEKPHGTDGEGNPSGDGGYTGGGEIPEE